MEAIRNQLKDDIGDGYHHNDGDEHRDVPLHIRAEVGQDCCQVGGEPRQTFADPEAPVGKARHNSTDYDRPNHNIFNEFEHISSSL